MSNYETDFYAWTQEQGALLRAHQLEFLDWENIAEEIESLGRREQRDLIDRLANLLVSLLKWRYQPEQRGSSWRAMIEDQRDQVQDILKDSPSLEAFLLEEFAYGYELGRLRAIRETDLPEFTFPTECPFSRDDALISDLER